MWCVWGRKSGRGVVCVTENGCGVCERKSMCVVCV